MDSISLGPDSTSKFEAELPEHYETDLPRPRTKPSCAKSFPVRLSSTPPGTPQRRTSWRRSSPGWGGLSLPPPRALPRVKHGLRIIGAAVVSPDPRLKFISHRSLRFNGISQPRLRHAFARTISDEVARGGAEGSGRDRARKRAGHKVSLHEVQRHADAVRSHAGPGGWIISARGEPAGVSTSEGRASARP